MVTHVALLQNMVAVRTALIARFNSFIHVTPSTNFERIRAEGLKPNRDLKPPQEVVVELGEEGGRILCLHSLGAQLRSAGTKDPPLISIAVCAPDLPLRVGLDWSYSWNIVLGRMELYAQMPIPEFVARIANEFGSVISYDGIPPERLRVYCRGNPPTFPPQWELVLKSQREALIEHG